MLGARLRLARYVATACKLTVAVASLSLTVVDSRIEANCIGIIDASLERGLNLESKNAELRTHS